MAGLTNISELSSTSKAILRSQDLREKVLAQLNEKSLYSTKPRPRNPLSKFTITSRSDDTIRPAHRTLGEESLLTFPALQREEKVLNTSQVTKLCTIFHKGNQVHSHVKDDKKFRKSLLQKKTVHGSLEDLRCKIRKTEKIEPNCEAPQDRKAPTKSIPTRTTSGDCQLVPVQSIAPEQSEPSETTNFPLPAFPKNSKPGENPYSTNQGELDSNVSQVLENCQGKTRGNRGPDGDCVFGPHDIQHNEENLKKLSLQNDILQKRVSDIRKNCTLYMVLNAFAFNALRKRSKQLVKIEESLAQRKVECAARIILHHLLLNSWRTAKGQVSAISVENTQLHKTIDNQSLQLNVIRKMQSMEKDKTSSVVQDYNEVKRNYSEAIRENETIKKEYTKVLEEKRALERNLRSLADDNSRLSTDLQIRLDKKDMQLRSMELDRFRAEKFSIENEHLARETEQARMQIKELTAQKAQWQEQAVSYESKCSQLKEEIARNEKTFEKTLNEKHDLSKENEILTLSKSKLEQAVEQAHSALAESNAQTKQLEQSYKACREELQDLEDQVEYLQSALRQYRKENVEIKQKLYDCTLKNVKRRRVWGAALYFFVNPIEAFKRLYFGSPEEIQQSTPANTATDRNLYARKHHQRD